MVRRGDLTPYYPFVEDVVHFHQTIKQACDRHHPQYYPAFKRWCDQYCYLKHRQETRGVGGLFLDYQDQRGLLYAGHNTQGEAYRYSQRPIGFSQKLGARVAKT